MPVDAAKTSERGRSLVNDVLLGQMGRRRLLKGAAAPGTLAALMRAPRLADAAVAAADGVVQGVEPSGRCRWAPPAR